MSSDYRDLTPLSLEASSSSGISHYGLASAISPWSTSSLPAQPCRSCHPVTGTTQDGYLLACGSVLQR